MNKRETDMELLLQWLSSGGVDIQLVRGLYPGLPFHWDSMNLSFSIPVLPPSWVPSRKVALLETLKMRFGETKGLCHGRGTRSVPGSGSQLTTVMWKLCQRFSAGRSRLTAPSSLEKWLLLPALGLLPSCHPMETVCQQAEARDLLSRH